MPRLVKEGPGIAPPPPLKSIGLNQDALKVVQYGCFGVASEPGGTSFRSTGNLGLWYNPTNNAVVQAESAPLGYKQVQLGGKTGTAQVRVITAAERARGVKSNNDLEWTMRDHSLYVCYGPVHKPRYACCIVVEHGGSTDRYLGGGSAAAAPVAADVMRLVLLRDPSSKRAATIGALEAAVNPRKDRKRA